MAGNRSIGALSIQNGIVVIAGLFRAWEQV
jgi:hypothetical protein